MTGRCTIGWRGFALAMLAAGLPGCLKAPSALPPCDSWTAEATICGLSDPEDLALYPDGGWVIVSEMRATREAAGSDTDSEAPFLPGRLTALRPTAAGDDVERRGLFPHEWAESLPTEVRWGDPACEGPPTAADFRPHGIDLGWGPDGRAALAVVTHGAREVVDLFEMLIADEPTVEWRGCVDVPDAVSANDVALVGDGGFVLTNMLPRFDSIGPTALWTGLKINLGLATGSVLRWSPGRDWTELELSRGSAPNGIAISRDRRTIYVAEWGGEAVYRLRFPKSGPIAGAVPVRDAVAVEGSPDNLTWTSDGRLLVASQQAGPLDVIRCAEVGFGGCDLGYAVTSIDPVSLDATRVAEGRGAASVALEVGDEIWVGVFVGDSIARLPIGD